MSSASHAAIFALVGIDAKASSCTRGGGRRTGRAVWGAYALVGAIAGIFTASLTGCSVGSYFNADISAMRPVQRSDDGLSVAMGGMGDVDPGGAHPGGESVQISQSEPVLARFFPDPPVAFDTPAFAATAGFTNHDQMLAYVKDLQRRSDLLHVMNLGFSQEGRRIPMLVFTTSGSGTAQALRASEKPTVWIHAQLHGNEPAAGEAALALAGELAGPLRMVLSRINVVIIPRVNVDGAMRLERDAADGRDLNRDAMRLDVSESLALRRASIAYAPAITVDAHEYYASRSSLTRISGGPWLESHDLLFLGPENPNVPERLRAFTNDVVLARISRDTSAVGLRSHPYYSVQVREAEEAGGANSIELLSGGGAARIGRNFHGLLNQVSILLESRGIGIGRQSFRRRVFSQLVAMRSVINTAWRDPQALQRVVDAARSEVIARGAIIGDRDDIVLQARRSIEKGHRLPFIDARAVEVRRFDTNWRRFDPAVPTLVRPRPYAYILLPQANAAMLRLQAFGVDIAKLDHAATAQVQGWRVGAVERDDALYEGVMRQQTTVELESHTIELPVGTHVVYMAQPLGNLIAECLEPEASDSFVRFGVLEARTGELLPVLRYMHPVGL